MFHTSFNFFISNCNPIVIPSSQCFTTCVTKAVYVLPCLWDGAYKKPLEIAHEEMAAGFLFCHQNSPLPFVSRHRNMKIGDERVIK